MITDFWLGIALGVLFVWQLVLTLALGQLIKVAK